MHHKWIKICFGIQKNIIKFWEFVCNKYFFSPKGLFVQANFSFVGGQFHDGDFHPKPNFARWYHTRMPEMKFTNEILPFIPIVRHNITSHDMNKIQTITSEFNWLEKSSASLPNQTISLPFHSPKMPKKITINPTALRHTTPQPLGSNSPCFIINLRL